MRIFVTFFEYMLENQQLLGVKNSKKSCVALHFTDLRLKKGRIKAGYNTQNGFTH